MYLETFITVLVVSAFFISHKYMGLDLVFSRGDSQLPELKVITVVIKPEKKSSLENRNCLNRNYNFKASKLSLL